MIFSLASKEAMKARALFRVTTKKKVIQLSASKKKSTKENKIRAKISREITF
jgi:hypothetical protein